MTPDPFFTPFDPFFTPFDPFFTPLTITNIAAPAGVASLTWQVDYEDEGFTSDSQLPDTNYSGDPTSVLPLTENYTFMDYGHYEILVTVTDGVGQTSEEAFDVTVNEAAPTLAVNVINPASASAPEGSTLPNSQSTVVFSATITNPDLDETNALYADFTGAGVYEQVDPNQWLSSTTTGDQTTVTFEHYYDTVPPAGAVYNAKFYADDDGQPSAVATVSVSVTAVPPTGDLMGIVPGSTVQLDGNGLPVVPILPATTLQFTNVADPSTLDTDGLVYYWSLNGGGWQETDINEFELPKPDSSPGVVTTVEAEIESPNGLTSAPQTIDVYNSVPAGSLFPMATTLPGGTFLPSPLTQAPSDYSPYDTYPSITVKKQPLNQTITATFVPDQATQTIAPKPSHLTYFYSITVYDVSVPSWFGSIYSYFTATGSTVLSTQVIQSTDPSVVVSPETTPAANSDDRKIVIYGGVSAWSGNNDLYPGVRTSQIVLYTPVGQNVFQRLANAYGLVNQLAQTFGPTGQKIATAILTNGPTFFSTLTAGLQKAFHDFTSSTNLSNALQTGALKWLGLQNVRIPAGADLVSALLSYAGLTVANLKSMVVQALGANNAAAASLVATLFNNAPDSLQGLQQVFNNINNAITQYGATAQALNLANVESQIKSAAIDMLETAAGQAALKLIAKFVPGVGGVYALLDGFSFLLTNQGALLDIVNDFVKTLSDLTDGNADDFADHLATALDNSLPTILNLASSLLSLGNLPQQVQIFCPNFWGHSAFRA